MIKVLIIEDNNDINNLLKQLLKDDYEITQAFAGTEGKRLIDEQHFDLMLPGMNDEELIKYIKDKTDSIIIVITAKSEIETLVEVLALGADDYIFKPFHNGI